MELKPQNFSMPEIADHQTGEDKTGEDSALDSIPSTRGIVDMVIQERMSPY